MLVGGVVGGTIEEVIGGAVEFIAGLVVVVVGVVVVVVEVVDNVVVFFTSQQHLSPFSCLI